MNYFFQTPPPTRFINSWNETDPLRTLFIGNPSKSYGIPVEFPTRVRSYNTCINNNKMEEQQIQKAIKCINNLIDILKYDYSIQVIRPDTYDHSNSIKTPGWELTNTNENSCPRDTFSILGNTILEAPMSWRCRYFESQVYHNELLQLWRADRNSRWIQPPKSAMTDNLYNLDYPIYNNNNERQHYANKYTYTLNNNAEPVFDAADILRCGKDLFVQRGFTTNKTGIEWIKREFGNQFRIHETLLENNTTPTHLDAELTILRPGLMMTCPEKPIKDDLLKEIKNEENDWELFEAPEPVNHKMVDGCYSSKWLSMNVLSIDENTVIVEKKEKPLIDLLENTYGFQVIPVDFFDAYMFGGGFHCQTLDICRDGTQKSYFPYFDRMYDK